MGKLIILILIVLIAFWIGRLSVSSRKNTKSRNNSSDEGNIDEGNIIDIEIEACITLPKYLLHMCRYGTLTATLF